MQFQSWEEERVVLQEKHRFKSQKAYVLVAGPLLPWWWYLEGYNIWLGLDPPSFK